VASEDEPLLAAPPASAAATFAAMTHLDEAVTAARPPRRVPEWVGRLIMGSGLSMTTEARGACNAKAKKVLGWVPRYPTWRDGFRTIRPEATD
jgi:hypothetical protein